MFVFASNPHGFPRFQLPRLKPTIGIGLLTHIFRRDLLLHPQAAVIRSWTEEAGKLLGMGSLGLGPSMPAENLH